ncbi:unnamed protein product [Adineta ricciae]|uniref:Cyclin-like domain-containing protein n=1 Tax=Adineta ricciae TaxID=249248 RepID=A0A816DWV3_ADIRI|nr:unnamed protein product [Adineta ricciae]
MSDYRNVVLTLSNVILPPEKLYPNPTPSMLDGLPWDVEYDLRLIGCELIQTACLLLKLPQTAVATGQVLFHRYYYTSSFIRRPVEIMAMACTNLAAKIEENARRIRDIINVFHHIKQVRSGSLIQPLLVDQTYVDRKSEVIKGERRLLKELGFCVYVQHPHKMITMYLKVLEKERETELVQTSWNYMNDSLRTDIFLRFTPETIACACIDLAARNLQIPLPKKPRWYLIFGAKPEEIHYIMIAILRLYYRRPRPLDELEKLVNICREKREDGKKRFRLEVGSDSPAQPSTVGSFSTPINTKLEASTVIEPPASPLVTTTTIVVAEEVLATTVNGTVTNANERESSTVNNHRHRHHDHRKKENKSRHRSSSRSLSKSPDHYSRKKKKPSHRSRSRSRSSSHQRHRHEKDRRYQSHHSSHNHSKKDKKRRSRSRSRGKH